MRKNFEIKEKKNETNKTVYYNLLITTNTDLFVSTNGYSKIFKIAIDCHF